MTSPDGFWGFLKDKYTPVTPPNQNSVQDASSGLPGTPEWWLRRLTNSLLQRQPLLDLRESYVEGNHTLPTGDQRFIQALQTMQRKSRTNYCGLVTSAPVERMKVRGFRFGPYGQADEDAKEIWSANDMDYQSLLIHQRASKYGMAYALVSPPEDGGTEYPIITAEDPRCCIIYRDPTRPTRALAGLRLWADDVSGLVLAVLYLREEIFGFVGPPVVDIQGLTIEGMKNRLLGLAGGPAGFYLDESVENELGEVPLVEFVWRPESGIIPEGEAGQDVRDIQDRINHTVLDRMVITRSQAYKQRWATGISIPKAKKGQSRPPFDPGADILWVSNSTDAKFGEFSETDITMLLEAIRDDVVDIAAITKTPPHYLMGKMANVSGETLSQAESGFVAKTKQRMNSMGWSYETVMKICFQYLGDEEKAHEVEASTLWDTPESWNLADVGDFIAKAVTGGVPLELVMDRLNFSPDEIEWAIKERDRLQQQQMDQQQQMMDAQTESQMQVQGQSLDAQAETTDKTLAVQKQTAAQKSAKPSSK